MKSSLKKLLVHLLIITVAAVSITSLAFAGEEYAEESSVYADNELYAAENETIVDTSEDSSSENEILAEYLETDCEEEAAAEYLDSSSEDKTSAEYSEEVRSEEQFAESADSDVVQSVIAAADNLDEEYVEASDIIREIIVNSVYIYVDEESCDMDGRWMEPDDDSDLRDFIYPNSIILSTLGNGEYNYKGNIDFILSELEFFYDVKFEYYITPDPDDMWFWYMGTHTATLTIGDISVDFEVVLSNDPCLFDISDLTVDDIDCFQELSGYKYYDEDEGRYHISYESFIYQLYELANITLTTIDGHVYSGNYYDIRDRLENDYGSYFYGGEFFIEDDDAIDWDLGEHLVCFSFYSYLSYFCVNLIENPVESVIIEDKTASVYEHIDYSYHDEDGNLVAARQYNNIYPLTITVVTKDGSIFPGNLYEVIQDLEQHYNCWIDYCWNNCTISSDGLLVDTVQLTVGENIIECDILGITTEYKYILTEEEIPDGFHLMFAEWFYFKDNHCMSDWTGLVKGTINEVTGWYYIDHGEYWPYDTGITKKADGSDNKWYFVKNGVFTKATGIAKRADGSNNKWYYVKNGIFTKATGIAKRADGFNNKWYYVKNGVYNKATCIAKKADGSSSTRYYVKNGVFNKYTGTVKISGKTYRLVKGVVK